MPHLTMTAVDTTTTLTAEDTDTGLTPILLLDGPTVEVTDDDVRITTENDVRVTPENEIRTVGLRAHSVTTVSIVGTPEEL